MLATLKEYGRSLIDWSGFFYNDVYDYPARMLSSMRLNTLFTSLFTYNVAASYHDNTGVLRYVNPKIGTYGTTPNGNGGMIPSVSLPFGMTRWTAQTRENFISQCPYHDADRYIHGFQATHQPAIWMGESGQVVLSPGIGNVKPLFTHRAHAFRKADERSTPYVYEIAFNAESVEANYNATESIYSPVPGGAQPVPSVVSEGANGRTRRDEATSTAMGLPFSLPDSTYGASPGNASFISNTSIKAALTATSHVGWLRLEFPADEEPYVFVQATRKNWTGKITVDAEAREVYGANTQRQDYALGPSRAPGFSGYFVSRFSSPFQSHGVTNSENIHPGISSGSGEELGAYVKFSRNSSQVEVRTGVSFVSIEQARRNLDIEASDDGTFESAVESLKHAWLEKLGRVEIEGANQTDNDHDPKTIFYTGLFHALQYPSDFSEPLTSNGSQSIFYSGYTDSVHQSNDSYYQSWSIWDTFRAEHSLLTLFAPERVNGMMRSLLQIYEWAGRLPMWANIVETNIMIGTHVDALIANALERGFRSFDVAQAWEAVKKNAFVPPENDTELLCYRHFDPTMQTEGLPWCLDLTQPDPTFALPIMLSAYMVWNVIANARANHRLKRNPSQESPNPTTEDDAALSRLTSKLHANLPAPLRWCLSKVYNLETRKLAMIPPLNRWQLVKLTFSYLFFFVAIKIPAGILVYMLTSQLIGRLQGKWLDRRMPIRRGVQPCRRPLRLRTRGPWE